MATGAMEAPGIAPEDVATVQRAAERGLPLVQQTKMREAEANRGLRGLELDSRAEKYRTQLEYADRAAQLAERRMDLQETASERSARIEREKLDIARRAATSAGSGGEAVKLASKDIPVFRDEARTALAGIKTLDQMQGLLAGGAGARPGQIKVFLSRLTGQQTEGMADAEVYQLLAETLRGPLREDIVGPGPMTEAEQRLLGQVTGGGNTGSKAASRLLEIYRESALGKVRNYNETRRRVGQTEPSVLRLYEELQIPGAGGQAPSTAPTASSIPTVSSRAAYDALPPGAQYKDPQGTLRTKKAR
jgi:hypothetical protein